MYVKMCLYPPFGRLVSNLNVYAMPGVGALNKNEPSVRVQSSLALKAIQRPYRELTEDVELQPALQYVEALTVTMAWEEILASSQ